MDQIRRSSRKLDTNILNSEMVRSVVLPRTLSLVVIFSLAFALLFGVTAHNQLTMGMQSTYLAEGNLWRQELMASPRGLFYDVNGRKLNLNELSYELRFDPARLSEAELEFVMETIVESGRASREELQERLSNIDPAGPAVLLTKLSSSEVVPLESKFEDLAVEFVPKVHRNYLQPEHFAHIIGYTGEASAEEVEMGFNAGDQVGKYRLEKVLDSELRGVPGKQIRQGGRVEQVPGVPGHNVFLTVDSSWQRRLYNILKDQAIAHSSQAGAAVIVDVENGDIKAYAGYPSFDANEFALGITQKQYQKLVDATGNPLVDKVVGLQASPGSTFKVLSALALLQQKTIDEYTTYLSQGCTDIGNYDFCEYGDFALGELDVVRALTRSSNIFFCRGMLKQVSEVGYEKYFQLGQQMGFGIPTGINLDSESAGVMPSPEYKQATFKESWFGGDTCNTVIGQGMVAVTPLQMAMLTATIANGGTYYRPNLVSKIVDQAGNVVKSDFHEVLRKIDIDPKAQSIVMDGMRSVVTSWEGTAYRFFNHLPGNFRAKTGSAEAYEFVSGRLEPRVHGWVVGTFDYQGRSYAFSAHLHYSGGGFNTVPIIERFANCLFSDFAAECEHI